MWTASWLDMYVTFTICGSKEQRSRKRFTVRRSSEINAFHHLFGGPTFQSDLSYITLLTHYCKSLTCFSAKFHGAMGFLHQTLQVWALTKILQDGITFPIIHKNSDWNDHKEYQYIWGCHITFHVVSMVWLFTPRSWLHEIKPILKTPALRHF